MRRPILAVALAATAIAACSSDGSSSAAPATASATTSAVAATEAPADTDAAAATIIEVEAEPTTEVIETTTSTTEPLGGVTIDDPMPEQVDAGTDPVLAEAAVRFAYQHWSLVDLDPALRARLVENGERNTESLEAGIAAVRSTIEFGRLAVDAVRFTGFESADVDFRAQWQGGPSPIFPDPMTGTAVFRDGSWRISSGTTCSLAFGMGQDCGGSSDQLPVSPPGLAVGSLPDDLVSSWSPEYGDLVAVPGSTSWQPSVADPAEGARALFITTDVLVGSSALDDAAAQQVLAGGRFGVSDGVPVPIASGRARMIDFDGNVQVVVLRNDDVLVSVFARGLSVDEVLAIVDGLTPTDLPAGFPPPIAPEDTGATGGTTAPADVPAATEAPAG